MPLYAFRCPDCLIEVEDIRTVANRNDAPACPDCHVTMERQLSASTFHVKGFSAINGYSRTDTGWVRHKNGIKTRVADSTGREK